MADQPKRIQRQRTKGWRMPPNTVSVTRPGKWGNCYKVGDYRGFVQLKTAGMAVEAYRRFLNSREGATLALEAQRELRGKNLACWCPVDAEWCHADVLLRIANP